MVNPRSELYERHPDWVLSAGRHERSVKRDQLVLNLGLPAVQQYILDFMTDLLASGDIEYIKWDCNRGVHEASSPSESHRYILGLYRIAETLNSRFPDVLFEGCASGGGRFDPGLLYYWPQTWTSDNTDALDRLSIQFGTTLVYPPSTMGCHVSACPNEQSGRVTPFEFRAHVAMMGGSFGFELDPAKLEEQERQQIPEWLALSERVSQVTLEADLYRLADPEESNYPAVLYMSQDGSLGALFAFCLRAVKRMDCGPLRLQGLDPKAQYDVDGERWTGAALMEAGLSLRWACKDFQSRLIWVTRVE
jgi:alpha-galactosidase